MIKILILGDVVGEPGRKAVEHLVPAMKFTGEIDFAVVNVENSAMGMGITETLAKSFFKNGCDILTTGDHIFDKRREVEEYIKKEPRLLRPANYPPGVPGNGSCVVDFKGMKIGVVNACGQVFMRYQYASPFYAVDAELEKFKSDGVRVILVDIHAEATSEKIALSWHLDGRVSAVVGSHTHVQTSDERVSARGTACLTDLGMCGPHDSVIGFNKEKIIQKFLTQMGSRNEVAEADIKICGAIVSIDERTGKAIDIKRVRKNYP